MVLACESIFSRNKLGCQTTKFAHFLKSKPETYKAYFPSGASKMQDAVFTCPTAINYKFYLPGAMGQAPLSSPVFNFDILSVTWTGIDTCQVLCFPSLLNPFIPGDLLD